MELSRLQNLMVFGNYVLSDYDICHNMSMKCTVCSRALRGRQRKFCSRECKNKSGNVAYQSYLAQQKRGRVRKLELIKMFRGSCEKCGYNTNYAALEFHHLDPGEKTFQLDLRSLSNRKWSVIVREARKCILLCSNCHAELHNPECLVE